jgi:hypothetical protein
MSQNVLKSVQFKDPYLTGAGVLLSCPNFKY